MTDRIIWAMIGVFALFAGAKPLLVGTPLFVLVPTISTLVPIVFLLLHGPREIGWARLVIFFLLTFAISWSYESLSIATGFPFGHYHYTDILGPKLGTVPLLVMPGYFGVAYVSWHIARLLLDYGRGDGRTSGLLTMVITASFVMVMWDVSMDPSRATVGKAWIWHQGGAYFGVPFVNFAGWLLCVATIFFTYSLVGPRFAAARETPDQQSYAQALGLYAAILVEFIAYLVFTPNGTVTDAAGQVWKLRDIYQSLGLVAIFTMGFVVLLGTLTLQRGRA